MYLLILQLEKNTSRFFRRSHRVSCANKILSKLLYEFKFMINKIEERRKNKVILIIYY